MAGDKEVRLAVLAGDGIGPEITDATLKALKAAADRRSDAWTPKRIHSPTFPVLRRASRDPLQKLFRGKLERDQRARITDWRILRCRHLQVRV